MGDYRKYPYPTTGDIFILIPPWLWNYILFHPPPPSMPLESFKPCSRGLFWFKPPQYLLKFQFFFILSFENLDFRWFPPPWNFLGVGMDIDCAPAGT